MMKAISFTFKTALAGLGSSCERPPLVLASAVVHVSRTEDEYCVRRFILGTSFVALNPDSSFYEEFQRQA